MIVLDEDRLRRKTIEMIAEDYYLPKKPGENYFDWLDRVIDRLKLKEGENNARN